MRHANPFRMTADIGMLLAFTLTALLGLSSATPTAVAGAQPLAPTGPPALTAAGKGAAVFEPNVATATIEVELLRPTVKEATTAAQAVMADVWAALVAQRVDESDIRAGHLSVFAGRFGPGGLLNEDEMRYHASNILFITIRDLDSIDAVLDAAIDAGANNIYSVDFTLPDPAQLRLNPRRAQAVVD